MVQKRALIYPSTTNCTIVQRMNLLLENKLHLLSSFKIIEIQHVF